MFVFHCQILPAVPPAPMETKGFSDRLLDVTIRELDDADNPMLCREYNKDVYQALQQIEAGRP